MLIASTLTSIMQSYQSVSEGSGCLFSTGGAILLGIGGFNASQIIPGMPHTAGSGIGWPSSKYLAIPTTIYIAQTTVTVAMTALLSHFSTPPTLSYSCLIRKAAPRMTSQFPHN